MGWRVGLWYRGWQTRDRATVERRYESGCHCAYTGWVGGELAWARDVPREVVRLDLLLSELSRECACA